MPQRPLRRQLILDGESFDVSVFGRRLGVGSKQASPLQGITLGGVAALRQEVFQIVDADEAAAFPAARPGAGSCFSSGRELGAAAVVAVAGGRRFHFADAEVAAAFDERVAGYDLSRAQRFPSGVLDGGRCRRGGRWLRLAGG